MLVPKLLQTPKPLTQLFSGFGGKEDWLDINEVKKKKVKPPINNLGFGKIFTDHMLTMKWTKKTGWEKPEIKPHGDLVNSLLARAAPITHDVHKGLQN